MYRTLKFNQCKFTAGRHNPQKFVHGPNGIAARQLSANGPLTPLHKGAKQNDGRTKGS